MVKKFLLALLLLWTVNASASHIVGGDIRLVQLIPNTGSYHLRLVLFFNQLTGHIEAEDDGITIAAYEKGTNKLVGTYNLPKTSNDRFLSKTSESCVDAIVSTRIIVYEKDVILSPATYSSPDGYYLVWERCCRNEEIQNITHPEDSGSVFKTEIPPVQVNKIFSNNTTPLFTSLNGDYACVGRRYYFNFTAVDTDGDSLVYALSTPLNGYTNQNQPSIPFANPAPYPKAHWVSGYDSAHAVPGPVPLSITSDGYVTGIADRPGLFLYTVVCSEYRKGKKLGECRRDYQLRIVDGCPAVFPPVTGVFDQNKHLYHDPEVITVSASRASQINVFTTDNEYANITYSLYPASINNLVNISKTNGIVLAPGDTLKTTMSWKNCKITGPYRFALITSKFACPFPVNDTLWINVNIILDPNAKPVISTDLLTGGSKAIEVGLDSLVTFKLFGTDADSADQVSLRGVYQGKGVLNNIHFANKTGRSPLESVFSWTPDCAAFNSSKDFYFVFYVNDNSCYTDHEESLTVKIHLKAPPIVTDLNLYNVFTPNGDGVNDFFVFPKLPADNCSEVFSSIEIYNRWGTSVFKTEDRNISWDGGSLPAGAYYYSINYTTTHYKSWVEIIR